MPMHRKLGTKNPRRATKVFGDGGLIGPSVSPGSFVRFARSAISPFSVIPVHLLIRPGSSWRMLRAAHVGCMKHIDMRRLTPAAQEERRRQVVGLRESGLTYGRLAGRSG